MDYIGSELTPYERSRKPGCIFRTQENGPFHLSKKREAIILAELVCSTAIKPG